MLTRNRFPNFLYVSALLGLLCTITTVGLLAIPSITVNNYAIQYNHIKESSQQQGNEIISKTIGQTSEPHRSFLSNAGTGHLLYEMGEAEAFFSYWLNSPNDPENISSYLELWGDSFQINQQWVPALDYYIAANQVALELHSNTPSLVTKAAILCQRLFLSPSIKLSEQSYSFCNDYFPANNDNLIIGGDISTNDIQHWKRRYFEKRDSADYRTEPDANNGFHIMLEGFENRYHGGVYQIVSLPAQTCILYRAKIKFESTDSFSARLLYWGGQQNGKPIGSQILTISNNDFRGFEPNRWQLVERVVNMPQTDNNQFEFFPVLLSGKGKVWIDDVSVELIENNSDC